MRDPASSLSASRSRTRSGGNSCSVSINAGPDVTPASRRPVNAAAELDHRRARVMMTSTTSNPGAGDGVLLKATLTEYVDPKSEPAADSISRRV